MVQFGGRVLVGRINQYQTAPFLWRQHRAQVRGQLLDDRQRVVLIARRDPPDQRLLKRYRVGGPLGQPRAIVRNRDVVRKRGP